MCHGEKDSDATLTIVKGTEQTIPIYKIQTRNKDWVQVWVDLK